jgi:hypothetical protein
MRAQVQKQLFDARGRKQFDVESTTGRGECTTVMCSAVESGVLSGASVTLTGIVPAGVILLGVTGRVLSAITGASSFDVGTAGDPDRDADNVALAAGTTFGIANATANPVGFNAAASNLVLTAVTSNFTGGNVLVCVHFLKLLAPSA